MVKIVLPRVNNQVVVYTAIVGGIDKLLPPLIVDKDKNVRYVCFSDQSQPDHGIWEVRHAELPYSNPRLNSRRYKILSHMIFPEADFTLWIDGNFQFNISPLDATRLWLGEHDMAVIKHPERNCIYEEARVCAEHKRDAPQIIEKQVARYRSLGFPENAGLVATGVILRRTSKNVCAFNHLWWQEIRRHSIRDQISFSFVAREVGIPFSIIPGYCWNHQYFKHTPHCLNIR